MHAPPCMHACGITGICTPQDASAILSQKLADELMSLDIDEALPITRACGHYLALTGIAELQHRQVPCMCRVGQALGAGRCMAQGLGGTTCVRQTAACHSTAGLE